MATKKITELSQANTIANNDLLVIVSNPASSSETKKVSVNTFFSNVFTTKTTAVTLIANTIINQDNRTPANSTITVTRGTMFYDNNYIYIAVSNNVIKRVALASF